MFSLLDAGKQGISISSSSRTTARKSKSEIESIGERVIEEEEDEDEFSKFQGGMWRSYKLQCEEMTCLI